jgi:Cu(I)/Ag(I) efflux system membrane fusion protein
MAAKKTVKAGVLLLILLAAALAWKVFQHDKKTPPQTQGAAVENGAQEQGDAEPQDKKKKIKYWVAPMDPTYIRNKPGKSPMGMDLIPVYEGEEQGSAEGTVRIDPVTVQNMGVRTEHVVRGPLFVTIRTVGYVTYDEERLQHINTKINGWVEDLFVNTTGEEIQKGQKLLSLYSPELVATQEEYLQAIKYQKDISGSRLNEIKDGAGSLLEATRKRLLLMDIDQAQIKALEERGEVQKTMLLRSSAQGVVIKKNVVEGMKVNPGMELYSIADLSRVWIIASVYEYEIPFLKPGQEAEITLPYEPGTRYTGKVSFIYPYLSAKTRTAQVRMEFRNPGLKLKPDMYADVVIKTGGGGDVLLVPSEAVIRTGTRNVVVKSLGEGKFLPAEVAIGPESEGHIQIISGLTEGEEIVTSGQFLIDSESNLREAINKMLEAKQAATAENAGPSPAGESNEEVDREAPVPKMQIDVNSTQKEIMSGMIDIYLNMHDALAAEEPGKVKAEAGKIADMLKKLRASDPGERLKAITGPVEKSLDGLLSGNLQKARDAFKILSRMMVGYVKGPGREDALSSGIKIYYCPMEKERWIEKGPGLKNPYLGIDMLVCGSEEKY